MLDSSLWTGPVGTLSGNIYVPLVEDDGNKFEDGINSLITEIESRTQGFPYKSKPAGSGAAAAKPANAAVAEIAEPSMGLHPLPKTEPFPTEPTADQAPTPLNPLATSQPQPTTGQQQPTPPKPEPPAADSAAGQQQPTPPSPPLVQMNTDKEVFDEFQSFLWPLLSDQMAAEHLSPQNLREAKAYIDEQQFLTFEEIFLNEPAFLKSKQTSPCQALLERCHLHHSPIALQNRIEIAVSSFKLESKHCTVEEYRIRNGEEFLTQLKLERETISEREEPKATQEPKATEEPKPTQGCSCTLL